MPEDYLEDHPTPPSLELDRDLIRQARRTPSLMRRVRRRRNLLIGLVMLGAAVLLASGVGLWTLTRSPSGWSAWVARVALTATPAPPDIAPPSSLKDLSAQYPELSGLLQDPALSSVYKDFILAFEEGGVDAAEDLAFRRGLLNERGEIRITLVVDQPASVSAVVEELRGAGITVEGSYSSRVNVGVSLALIQRLSAEHGTDALFERLTQMEHIIRLELPLRNRVDRVSRVQGEGVSITGADVWHQAGVTGQGMRIGILDLGFDGYRDLLGTELPDTVSAKSFVYGAEPDGSDEVHGTACAEIVHEMAPDAELFLAYYDGTTVSEGQAIDWLLDQDVHIISHSAGSVMAPMDGTGQNAELVDRAAQTGVLWVNSAGNEAEGHYRGTFTDQDGDGLHEFPDGSEELALEAYGDAVTVVLNWNDWEAVTEDYDIFVYDAQGDLVASAEDAQDGSPGQVSAEGLVLYGASGRLYYVSISAYQTSRPAVLDLFAPGADVAFPTVEHSLNSPADARGALTVGATEYRDDSIASYSSQGPTTDGRLKPEMSAPAGVSGSTYGGSGFDGTSASTPHVAGAAALVWSAFPEFSRDRVASYLTSEALDLGPSGPDNAFGHGRLRLSSPPEEGEQPVLPIATELPVPTGLLETLVPTGMPFPTLTPPVALEVTEVAVTPTPGEVSSSTTSAPPAALLIGLASIGLCGGVAVVGGAGLLLLARRGVPGQPQRVPSVSPSPAPPPAPTRYGELTGGGLDAIPLSAGTITLGRDSGNDVVLPSPQVSRRHARVICAEGRCTVEDLGSSNGVFLDGERITRGVLNPGSRVRLGGVELTYSTTGEAGKPAWVSVGEERYPVPPTGAIIGRSHQSDIQLSDQLASRRHACIDREARSFTLRDLGSTNGTFLNDRSIRVEQLHDGDRIRIGKTYLDFHSPIQP